MYCENGSFPGLNRDGGFADYLLTNERALIKLNPNVAPIDVAPLADAGITAYRVAKKAAKLLTPGQYCVVLGVGGLGHVALQSLHELCGARTIAVDRSEAARKLAKELGATHVIDGGDNVVEEVKELTHGGAHAVIDFVGELGAEQVSWQMLRPGGTHYVVGYGGQVQVPTVHMVISEMAVAGSLVGNYMELVELMELNAEGRVKLHAQQYKLADINKAIDDFKNRKIVGRGVIVP
jgi:NAD+-dependent secondary alcohol dehydrogenase Adh1